MGKLINRIQGSRLWISSLPGSALITHIETLGQQTFSKPCLVNLISKDTHLVFSISRQASRCQQAFSKPLLVHLISKDTHLVFSISLIAWLCQFESRPCLVNLISKDTHLVFSLYPVSPYFKATGKASVYVSLSTMWFKNPKQISRD